jgi:hypothetical protein
LATCIFHEQEESIIIGVLEAPKKKLWPFMASVSFSWKRRVVQQALELVAKNNKKLKPS